MYDFDKIIDRKGTGAIKFDLAKKRGHSEDELSLWVADMDFLSADEIIEDLKKRAAHGIFGYTVPDEEYKHVVASWFEKHHGYRPKEDWFVLTPGVVFGLSAAVRAFTKAGDSVLIQPPVYYPFFNVIKDNDRVVVENRLKYEGGKYSIDFEDLERKLASKEPKMMIFCTPHNPVGKIWTKEEVTKVATLCAKYGVILAADEIHCDFAWEGHEFYSAARLPEDLLKNTVICTAPSKTFNLAGLQISNIFIPDAKKKAAFERAIYITGYDEPNAFGLVACKSAYSRGENWLSSAKKYIRENIDYLNEYVKKNIPELYVVPTEGTYLVWIDFKETGLSGKELDDFIKDKAKLWLDEGSIFGGDAGSFQRINVACSREYLKEALKRLELALKARS